MTKRAFFTLISVLPALATEYAPPIPDGPIDYDGYTYENSYPGYEPYNLPGYAPTPAPAPISASSSAPRGYVNLNLISSDYTVRGMGFRDYLTEYGYTSLSGSCYLPNRNLFGRGIHHRISGEYGIIWDASSPLGQEPLARLGYALGKEIFPNLTVEAGYNYLYGGFEGYMARHYEGASHTAAQELFLSVIFNDQQRGFFGKALAACGFYGLEGVYFDFEAGYRFTDIAAYGNFGADCELSFGIAPSCSYWGSEVEGVDAFRIKAALLPFSHTGRFGRDARAYVKPWIQCSWSGSNAAEIDRSTGGAGPIDHFLITVGIDCGLNF